MVDNSLQLIGIFLGGFRPPEKMEVCEFAEKHYIIPKGNVEPGSFRPLPYQRDILNGFTDETILEHVLCFPVQSSKTTLFTVFIAYLMALDPCNVLVKYPTLDQAELFGRVNLGGILEEMPILSGLVSSNKSKEGTNTLSLKKYKGGEIRFRGESARGLRGYPSKVVIQDEISSDSPSSDDEGSGIDLADNRAESYGSRSVLIKASTPKLKGSCEIWKRLEETDFQKWEIPCPHCQTFHALEWENVKWDKSTDDEGKAIHHTETARLVCPHCDGTITDTDRIRGIYAGRWKATRPENFVRSRRRGYHLNALYRLIGEKTIYKNLLHRLASEWIEAKRGGPISIQGFVNNQLALPFEPVGEKINDGDLVSRGESYDPQTLPKDIGKVVLSVDVQGDRLETEVCGYAANGDETTWGIRYKVFPGNPRYPEIWNELTDYLTNSTFQTIDGRTLKIDVTFVDVGWGELAETVSRYCVANIQKNVWAVKGQEVAGNRNVPPVIGSTPAKDKHGLPFYWLGTRAAKETIYNRLSILEPNKAGYCHFPIGNGYDPTYFKKLTTERRVTKWEGGKSYFTFVNPEKRRNEPLDLRTMGLAAYRKVKGWASSYQSAAPAPRFTIPGGREIDLKNETVTRTDLTPPSTVPAFRPITLNFRKGSLKL